jgi:hypothetical protein
MTVRGTSSSGSVPRGDFAPAPEATGAEPQASAQLVASTAKYAFMIDRTRYQT